MSTDFHIIFSFCLDFYLNQAIIGPMPRLIGTMDEIEKAISDRLRQIRARVGWSQTDFANGVGVSRDSVTRIELGLAPVRYLIGDTVCAKFDICQRWLATGTDPQSGYIGIPVEIGVEIGRRELFSVAYHRVIESYVFRAIQDAENAVKIVFGASDDLTGDRLAENYAYHWANMFFRLLPLELRQEFYGYISAASSAFIQSHRAKLEGSLLMQGAKVKSSMASLIERLKKVVDIPDGKESLARYVKTDHLRIERWLAGKEEPSGEFTLHLLEWVKAEEAKQRDRGSAITPPRRKTRSTQSAYEKEKRVRREK
jgi:transcriptional regulator with XRE-family HTH domain